MSEQLCRDRFVESTDKLMESFNASIDVDKRLYESDIKGSQAHLEMTGDDLLTTGVSIMARPPGKRLSTIHLMSGGEKALTAVAMVFAIFELNPAPFCMLDEVDAPLDEANVGRFLAMLDSFLQPELSVGEVASLNEGIGTLAARMLDSLYVLGDPPDYEPTADAMMVSIAAARGVDPVEALPGAFLEFLADWEDERGGWQDPLEYQDPHWQALDERVGQDDE